MLVQAKGHSQLRYASSRLHLVSRYLLVIILLQVPRPRVPFPREHKDSLQLHLSGYAQRQCSHRASRTGPKRSSLVKPRRHWLRSIHMPRQRHDKIFLAFLRSSGEVVARMCRCALKLDVGQGADTKLIVFV